MGSDVSVDEEFLARSSGQKKRACLDNEVCSLSLGIIYMLFVFVKAQGEV